MLLEQEKFYYKFGVRKPLQLLEPKVLHLDTMLLPMYSFVHMVNPSEDYYPSRLRPILKNVKDAIIYNKLNYEPMLHEVIELPLKEKPLITKLNKQYSDFTTYTKVRFNHFLSTKQNKLRYIVPIITYKYMDEHYRYPESNLSKIKRFENKYATIVKSLVDMEHAYEAMNIKNNDFKHYLVYEIPKVLYDINIIKRFLDADKDMTYLKLFHNETYMFMLELMKLLNSSTQDSSLLKDLKDLNHVDIIFKYNASGVIVNLKTLLSFNKDLDETGMFHDNVLLKNMIELFNIILNSQGLLEEEAEAVSSKEELLTKLKSVEKEEVSESGDIIDSTNEAIKIAEQEHAPLKENIVETIEFKNKYDKIADEDIVKINPTIEDLTLDNLKELNENNKLDKKKYEKLTSIVKETLNKPSPFKDGTKIKDNLTIDKKEVMLAKEETKLPDIEVVYNKEDLHDPIYVMNNKYLKDVYKKDIVSSIMGIQASGMIVEDIEVVTHEDSLGDYDEYKIKLNDLGKTAGSTVTFMIPKVNEDGSYYISGNEYRLRFLKSDAIIKKIRHNRVSLSTAYGKLFVDKSPYKKLDRGYSLRKELLKLANDNVISNFTTGTINVFGENLPTDYTLFGRYVKSFMYKNNYFNFNFNNRKELIKDKQLTLDKIEDNKKYILCGYRGNSYIVMDKNNILYLYNGKYEKLGSIFDLVPIDITKLKKEYSLVKIFKNYVPTAYMLTYYMGIKNMLKSLKVKYELLEGNKRVEETDDKVVVKLDGETLIMYPNNDTDKLILNGFNNDPKIFKQVTFNMLNHKDQTLFIFKEMNLNLVSITEIKALETLFIDPVSKSILEQQGEPTTFIGLLIRSTELLIDDNYMHPQSFEGFAIKGYERIPQLMYKTLVSSIKKKMSGDTFGRTKIVVDPYSVWRNMNEDSSSVLIDDINPIAYLKQKEDTTLLGAGGRKKDSLVGKDRAFHEDDVGILSESSKDSGDVGITAYLSANPKFDSIRGTKDKDKKLNWSNVLSTSAMLVPFSTTDDPKRVLYMNIQNSHIVPIEGAEVYPVRSGYEAVLPYKVGTKYIQPAEDDGVVVKVKDNSITVKYKKLGKKTYTFKDWTSKEESNMAYLHKMVTNLKDNEKISKDDILYYDKSFFDIDIFNKHRVVYRASINANIALIETSETNEDSILLGKRLSRSSVITYTKIRDITLDASENIKKLIDVGTYLKPNDPLFLIVTDLEEDSHMSEETLDLLQGFVKNTPKAKYKGKLLKIKVYYNCEKKELSRSLKKLVEISEEYMDGQSGKVSSGYSINGKPLEHGKVHIKFYIEISQEMGVADKGIVGPQLKTTAAQIVSDPIKTEDGEDIDALFSLKGVYARITNTSFLMGTSAKILKKITDNAIDMYFK